MTIIENPVSNLPAKLQGLHLFGFSGAPCAQRVRFALGEKGFTRSKDIPWNSEEGEWLRAANETTYVSRNVSLPKKQHVSKEYAAIHPNMVVPALVHDGVLHIESMDIIRYLDKTWPENKLIPDDSEARSICDHFVTRASELHRSVRYMSFKWSFGGLGKLNKEQVKILQELEKDGSPEQLVSFYDQFNNDSISRELYEHHLQLLETGFSEFENQLRSDNRPWICGDTFTMADIVWTIKMLRIKDCGYPFDKNYPLLTGWYNRATARQGFIEGVWRDVKLSSSMFRTKARIANLFNAGIAQMSQVAA